MCGQTIGAPKTKTLTMSTKAKCIPPSLIFQDTQITEVKTHKHLGLTFSSDLKWSQHINELQVKAYKRLNILKNLKYKLDRNSLETTYMSFIRPTLEYADCVWAGTYDTDLNKLEKVQTDAMRIVSGATARSNINNLYEELCWPSLGQRRLQHTLTMFYKITHGEAPAYLCNILPQTVGARNEYKLRSAHKIDIPFARLECYRRSFFPFASREWNKLSYDTIMSPSIKDFKKAISNNRKDTNLLYYYGQRWPSIHHARIRMGCSKLNQHLFTNHLIENPSCVCGHPVEDATHYFLNCPRYAAIRIDLLNNIALISRVSTAVLLYGNKGLDMAINKRIFDEVHKFIISSHRFE
jgi:hypothetical protein